jgi:hypothetical protein
VKSLLWQTGATPFVEPSECTSIPCRQEVPISIRYQGSCWSRRLRSLARSVSHTMVSLRAGTSRTS